ncbi:response regulator transcription factor [Providencia sneebia]|uniref:LuxR family transcriptional regulator n=1 Tax=Providencia sneebia DSM 19967 TaxID=1141660 RepID=K8W129_9GAMM|nr:LuxR C-terminal-related transcriptional regulator [Providencia sneebia]EKT54248.1 LuxR family transcriptional regulator [Providencia sneebia DSM 19967]
MNNTIHVIIENDNVIKNKLKSVLDTFGFNSNFYCDIDIFTSNYTYPSDEGCADCILIFVNNDDNYINKLNNLNALFGLVPFIVLSEDPSITLCRESFKSGAFDFFSFPFKENEIGVKIVHSINEATNNFIGKIEEYKQYTILTNKFNRLSKREKEIMDMIIEGNTSKEVAEKLDVSPRTVEVHRSNIYTKLGIKSLPQLIQEYHYINTYTKNTCPTKVAAY